MTKIRIFEIYLLSILYFKYESHYFPFYMSCLFILFSLANEIYIICNCFIYDNCLLVYTMLEKYNGVKGICIIILIF